jgi:cytochrome c553
MYTAFLHTHKLVVLLFLFIYLVKTVFLLIPGKEDILERITKAVKVPEMVIALLMLISGLYLLLNTGNITTLLIIKITLVFVSIPVAIIGFKKRVKPVAALSFLLIVGAYGLAEVHKKRLGLIQREVIMTEGLALTPIEQASRIYMQNCAACHGADGSLGLSGATNLQTSVISGEDAAMVISRGKGNMPKYGNQLNDAEIAALVEFTQSLRK